MVFLCIDNSHTDVFILEPAVTPKQVMERAWAAPACSRPSRLANLMCDEMPFRHQILWRAQQTGLRILSPEAG